MNSKFTVAAALASIAASQGCIQSATNDCGYAPTVWDLALELADENYIEYQAGCSMVGSDCKLREVLNKQLKDVNSSLWQGFLYNIDLGDDPDAKAFSAHAVTTLNDFI